MNEQKERNIRDYGYGKSDQFVKSVPRIVGPTTGLPPCPNCGCETTYDIEVDVQHPLGANGGKGIGRYIGCAACPFASPMMMAFTEGVR